MSDLDLTKKTNFSQNQNTGSSQNLKDQVADAGAELKQRAGDRLRASTDIARDKFKEAADAAKDVASGTADQIQGQAREKQRSGGDFIERFAGNIREAARAFENDAPFAARGINSAAEYVEGAAEKIRDGSFRDLVDNAADFAKRQPAAFLGIFGARGLYSSALPQGIRRRRLIFIAQRYEPGVIFAACFRWKERDYICSGQLIRGQGSSPAIAENRNLSNVAVPHEHSERYQNKPERASELYPPCSATRRRNSPSSFRTRSTSPKLNSVKRFRRSAARWVS